MGFHGYIINVELSATNTLGQRGATRYAGRLYIPKSISTKADIQIDLPDSSSSSVGSITSKFQLLNISGFGCPYFNKGQYNHNLNTLQSLNLVRPIISNCFGQEVAGEPTETFIAITTLDNNNGLYARRQARQSFIYNSETVAGSTSGTSDCFGIAAHFNDPYASAISIFISSDNYVAFANIHTAYNPKTITWLNREQSDKFIAWLESEENLAEADPYSGGYGGYSGTGGGGGNHDISNDAIPVPSVPTLSATNAGFCTAYNPTLVQLQALANYMWTDTIFDINNLKKLFADPMDVFMGLLIVPVAVDNGGNHEFLVGNWSTGLYMNTVANQYQTVDCGSIDLEEFWGAYLDYSPYTKIELYLPFIGTVPINADDFMGKTMTIKYNVDLLTGSCVAFVYDGLRVLYSFPGNCAISIPFSGDSYTEMIKTLIGIASTAITAGLTVGAGALAEGGTMANAVGAGAKNVAGAGASSALGSINSFIKPNYQRSGSMGSTQGLLGIRKPYLVITRPNLCLPERQNHYIGYPVFQTVTLSTMSGFTTIHSIHLEGLDCTDNELVEIENLLKSGVIF